MSTGELNGFYPNLFMGKAKCATLPYYMPLFNGNFPPRFVKTEAEIIGVPSTANKKQIDPDMGPNLFNIVRVPSLQHAFKTPTIRNASLLLHPYMHNGVFKTLHQVMWIFIIMAEERGPGYSGG